MATPAEIRKGLDYLRSCIRLGVRYVWWNGVWPPDQNIFYMRHAPPPPPADVSRDGVLCSGVINLFNRAVNEKAGEGTLWWQNDLANKRAFNPNGTYPVGTVLGHPFERDQNGHVVIVSTPPDANGQQWTIGADSQYGLNERRTVKAAHSAFGFTYAGEIKGVGVIPLGGDAPADKVLFGIDAASYQKGIDMARVEREGYEFAVVKASEGPAHDGWSYLNPEYRRQVEGAKAAGLIPGSYHFLLEGPAKPQVDLFLKTVGNPSGQLLMVDFEDYPSYPSYTPTNRALREFVKELRARVGDRPALVYSGQGFWDSGDPSGLLAQYGSNLAAWDAFYPLGGEAGYGSALYERCEPHGWGERWGGVEPRIWQFSANGKVAGFELDVNAFRGTRDELLALTGKKPEPSEPPKPEPDKSWRRRTEERLALIEGRLDELEAK